MRRVDKKFLGLISALGMACSGTGSDGATSISGGTDSATSATSSTGTVTGTVTGTGTSTGTTSTGTTGSTGNTKLDVSFTTGTTTATGGNACKVSDGMDAVGTCREKAPPNSFESDVQWSWNVDGEIVRVLPLVGNLTDDNNDGEIDLCDVPDVVVLSSQFLKNGFLHILDGATGVEHFSIAMPVFFSGSPAIGDIDGDGIMEIVAATPTQQIIAFEHDGTHKWTSTVMTATGLEDSAIALADLDADGDVEIHGHGWVLDHTGQELWEVPYPQAINTQSATAQTSADLDGDGDLEVVLGHAAYHHDGTELWNQYPTIVQGFPQVANLDDDPEPEILVTNQNGISVLEHDGVIKFMDLRPTGDPPTATNWVRPATVHDFDGDGISEFAVSSGNHYATYERDGTLRWQATIADLSGIAGGTAFDFLGDATAEAMYADEVNLFVYDDSGTTLLQVPRNSSTFMEYPVVADVDNDGSAEIVVVSEQPPAPLVQVIRDDQDRWIQARRIWNQHTYHVTNVLEDGTIPQVEPRHWESLNTFRTNAQIEGGAVCKPEG